MGLHRVTAHGKCDVGQHLRLEQVGQVPQEGHLVVVPPQDELLTHFSRHRCMEMMIMVAWGKLY